MTARAARDDDAAARPMPGPGRGLRGALAFAPSPGREGAAPLGTPSIGDALACDASALLHRLQVLARAARTGRPVAIAALERCAADAAALSRRAEGPAPAGGADGGALLRQVRCAREDVRSSMLLVTELLCAATRG